MSLDHIIQGCKVFSIMKEYWASWRLRLGFLLVVAKTRNFEKELYPKPYTLHYPKLYTLDPSPPKTKQAAWSR